MKNVLKTFFYFTRSERRGILLLCTLILLVSGGTQVYRHWQEKASRPSAEERAEQLRMQQEYEDFLATIQEEEEKGRARHRYPEDTGFRPGKPAVTPFPFDPNRADSLTLRRLGLPGWMARNIVRYRERGGCFRHPEDFRKIYGLTDEQYAALEPYIRIAPQDTARPAPPRLSTAQTERDTLARPYN